MKQITSLAGSLRGFWASDPQRKTLMWVIAAVSVVVLIFGVFQIVQGQLDYQDGSDQLDDVAMQINAFTSKFPTGTDSDGTIKPDLTTATQEELMMLATFKRQELEIKNERVDAYNARATGIRIAGIAVIGFALAYLVAPTGQKPDAVKEADQPPPDDLPAG